MYAWLNYGVTIRGFVHDSSTIDTFWNQKVLLPYLE